LVNKAISLRQHDLDQVMRVERGSLLSVPHRGTPRSVVTSLIKRAGYFVNTKNITQQVPPQRHATLGDSKVSEPFVSILLSFATRLDLPLNQAPENL
jgi:hypothetical protein